MTTIATETKHVMMERTYNAPISAVWGAITDKNKMQEWYFTMSDFKPEPGFEFSFTCAHEGKSYVHLCRITEVIPGKKLAHTWAYAEYPGESLVTFELFEEGYQTRLKLTHTGLETFPADDPFFIRENYAEGWNAILGKDLKEYVEKK
jgi:uncharacterized protein YndB with AHSA1/START domain